MADLPLNTEMIQSSIDPEIVSLRCPVCGSQGSFHGRSDTKDVRWQQRTNGDANVVYTYRAGVRICPSPTCNAPIFVLLRGSELYRSYPPEVLDFDATDLPATIAASLEEAIKCHAADCYRASALMVRRTLEEVCEDKKATGKDLKARLVALGNSTLIPKELLDAADELRILGNDAAHIEAKAYDQIGKPEAEIAIDLAKELLKAVYQYSSLLDRLRKLKRP